MTDLEGLHSRCDALSRDLVAAAKSGKKILVVTHIDADGIASGSIAFSALMRKGANVAVRCVPELDLEVIRQLSSESYDLYVFTDLASALVEELEASLGGRFLVVDHHQLAREDMGKPAVLNAWTYGYDGGREACSSSLAYILACALDASNSDLSPLAVVGAVADRQDSGPGRALTGLNRVAVQDSESAGLVTVSRDMTFTGRETRPVHDAIASTSTPYLEGVTGNNDAVLSALHQSGLRLKEGGSWRTVSSLSQEEKMKVAEVLAGMLGGTAGATEALSGLIGEVYTLELEDSYTPLRDAREFATLLNACGRMGSTGAGVSICLGDRSAALKEGMATLAEYRLGLGRALRALSEDPSRFLQQGSLIIVRANGLVAERLLGPVASILSSSPERDGNVLVAITDAGDSEMKVSSRVGDSYRGEVNIGLVMREAAEAVGGVGGGHTMAAGAKIASHRVDEFTRIVIGKVAA